MPCYEVNMMTVKLEAANKRLLKEAAESMGLRVRDYQEYGTAYGSILVKDGTAQFDEYYVDTFNQLKVEYSKKVVMKAAKAKGWTGTWMRNKENPTVQLRRY